MKMKKLSYREYILAFILLITFVVSMSVAVLSNRTDSLETRMGCVEDNLNNIIQ